jgi:hypothetical protein
MVPSGYGDFSFSALSPSPVLASFRGDSSKSRLATIALDFCAVLQYNLSGRDSMGNTQANEHIWGCLIIP